MLDEVIFSSSSLSRIANESPDSVELVITGKDDRFSPDCPSADLLLFDLDVNEPGDNVEEAVPFQYFFPEVCSLVIPGNFQVPSTAVVTSIEREEMRAFSAQASGHVGAIGIDGKMDESPFSELKDEIVWVPVVLVLVFGMFPVLAGHRVLEFKCDDRNPIQTENYIERVVVFWRIFQLPGYGQGIVMVTLYCLGVQAAGRSGEGDLEEFSVTLESMTKHREAAFMH